MVALDLEAIVVGAADADVAVANSVKEASRVLRDAAFDAALLDIDVLDGKTFPVAQLLANAARPSSSSPGRGRKRCRRRCVRCPSCPSPTIRRISSERSWPGWRIRVESPGGGRREESPRPEHPAQGPEGKIPS